MSQILWVVMALFAIAFLLFSFLVSSLLSLWLQAYLSGAPVSIMELIGMKFRKVDPRVIVHNYIMARKAFVELNTPAMEAHYLAGGDFPAVVRTMIGMDRANVELPWDVAAAIDLAGYDLHATAEAALMEKLASVTFEYAVKRGLRKQRSGATGER